MRQDEENVRIALDDSPEDNRPASSAGAHSNADLSNDVKIEPLNLSEDFIEQLEEAAPVMSAVWDTSALQKDLAQFVRKSTNMLKSSGLNEFFNRVALSMQFGALMVDTIDTFAPTDWVNAHSCYQPDGSRDFSRDIPKLLFLGAMITYGLLDYGFTRSLGPQSLAKFRRVELPAITAGGVSIFLENLKPALQPNLGLQGSTSAVRTVQGLIVADFVREMIRIYREKENAPDNPLSLDAGTDNTQEEEIQPENRLVVATDSETDSSQEARDIESGEKTSPESKPDSIPAVLAGILSLGIEHSASAVRMGTLAYTSASVFANVFVLAVMANDPKNFQGILNGILGAGMGLGVLAPLNEKVNNFVDTYISTAASNMNLSLLAMMSLVDCWFTLDPVENPVKWMCIAISMYAAIGSLTAVLTKSNATYASRSPAFFTPEARTETPTENTPLNINRG